MNRTIGVALCLIGVVLTALGLVAPWTAVPAPVAVARAVASVAFYTQNERFVEAPHITLTAVPSGSVVTIVAIPKFVERAVVTFDRPIHACRQTRDVHVFVLPLDPPRSAIAFFAQPPGLNHAVTCRMDVAALQRAAPDPQRDALIARTRLEYAVHPGLGTQKQRLFPAWDKVLVLSPTDLR
jgi:hypothetical protein